MKPLLLLATLLVLTIVGCGGGASPDTTTSSATATAVAVTASSGLTVNCTLDAEQLKISCQATGQREGSQLKWTSTASWANSGGSQWEFTINEELIAPTAQVILEECEGTNCQSIETSIDTSAIVSKKAAAPATAASTTIPSSPPKPVLPTPSPTVEPPPILSLPFTSANEPLGMMPLGETVLHPATPDLPMGHPGIDFQWPFQAEVVAVTNGEVAEIRTSELHGSPLYTVLVISGDFVSAYEVTDLYAFNPDLGVGSEVVSGQVIGYAQSIGSGDGWTMMHWSFGKWKPGNEKPNPEGVVEKFIIDYLCPVPYFSDTEQQRLFRLWTAAKYPNSGGFTGEELRERFPDVCNGPLKNY